MNEHALSFEYLRQSILIIQQLKDGRSIFVFNRVINKDIHILRTTVLYLSFIEEQKNRICTNLILKIFQSVKSNILMYQSVRDKTEEKNICDSFCSDIKDWFNQ